MFQWEFCGHLRPLPLTALGISFFFFQIPENLCSVDLELILMATKCCFYSDITWHCDYSVKFVLTWKKPSNWNSTCLNTFWNVDDSLRYIFLLLNNIFKIVLKVCQAPQSFCPTHRVRERTYHTRCCPGNLSEERWKRI